VFEHLSLPKSLGITTFSNRDLLSPSQRQQRMLVARTMQELGGVGVLVEHVHDLGLGVLTEECLLGIKLVDVEPPSSTRRGCWWLLMAALARKRSAATS
jgi:hypothetical protein